MPSLLLHGTGISFSYYMGLFYDNYDMLKNEIQCHELKFQCISGSIIATLFFVTTNTQNEYFILCNKFISQCISYIETTNKDKYMLTVAQSFLDHVVRIFLEQHLRWNVAGPLINRYVSIWVGEFQGFWLKNILEEQFKHKTEFVDILVSGMSIPFVTMKSLYRVVSVRGKKRRLLDSFIVGKQDVDDITITPFKMWGTRCSMHGSIDIWNCVNIFQDPYTMFHRGIDDGYLLKYHLAKQDSCKLNLYFCLGN